MDWENIGEFGEWLVIRHSFHINIYKYNEMTKLLMGDELKFSLQIDLYKVICLLKFCPSKNFPRTYGNLRVHTYVHMCMGITTSQK